MNMKHILKATLNSMVPLWKKDKKNIKNEEYNNFYQDRFHDYEEPLKSITFQYGRKC